MNLQEFEKIDRLDNNFEDCFRENNYSVMDLSRSGSINLCDAGSLELLESFKAFDFRKCKKTKDFILIDPYPSLSKGSFEKSALNIRRIEKLNISSAIYIQNDLIFDVYKKYKIEGVKEILFKTKILTIDNKKAVLFKACGETTFYKKEQNNETIEDKKEELKTPIENDTTEVVKKKGKKYTREELDLMHEDIIKRSKQITILRSKMMIEYDQNEKEKIKKQISSDEKELKSIKGVYDYHAKAIGIKKPFFTNENQTKTNEKKIFVSSLALQEGYGKILKIKDEIDKLKIELRYTRSLDDRKSVQKKIDFKNQELGKEEEKYKNLQQINKNAK